VLVRVNPPGYRTDLWLWLQNSGLKSLAREGEDGVRVLAEVNSRARLEEVLSLWESRNPGATLSIIDGA
jgi:hypothetical protein